MYAKILLIAFGFLSVTRAVGQDDPAAIRWLDFAQLELALAVEPRPVFVHFYADWCTVCHRMDKRSYTNPAVVELLNDKYYAVRMDIETADTIIFGGQTFVNERIRRVNPVHQIPLLMASRTNRPFSLPAMILLDGGFVATGRYFQFLSAAQLLDIL